MLYTHLGFTGGRSEPSKAQVYLTREIIRMIDPEHAHHGVCIGSDEMFHNVCWDFPKIQRWLHRPYYPRYEAKVYIDRKRDMVMHPLPYEERNQEIVGCSDAMLAVPDREETLRSGTWMTVRFARKVRRPIYIIFRDGRVRYEYVPVEHRLGSLLR